MCWPQAERAKSLASERTKEETELEILWRVAIILLFISQPMSDRQAVIAQFGAIETCRIPVMSSIDDEKKHRALN